MKVVFQSAKYSIYPFQKIGMFINSDTDSRPIISFRRIEHEDLRCDKCYPFIRFERRLQ